MLFTGRGDRGLVRGKSHNTELACKSQTIKLYHRWSGLEWERLGLGLCGLDQTGRTLSTYRGSCDRIHSVFLVLFWLGMDLEKQKDGATDMHIWKFFKWYEPPWNCCFFLVKYTLAWTQESLGRSLLFSTVRQSCTVSLVQERSKIQS